MTTGQQTAVFEPNFWTLVDKVLSDLLTQQIPASVVLLIIICMVMPWVLRFVWRWYYGTGPDE